MSNKAPNSKISLNKAHLQSPPENPKVNTQQVIPLRQHTPYSLLEGAVSMEQLIKTAAFHQVQALGLADTGHLFGGMEFSMECQKKGIQPILGCKLSLMDPVDAIASPVVLYAQNQEGFRQLCRLISASTLGQPSTLRGHITYEQLAMHTEGLLLLTGGPSGPVDQRLERGNGDRAKEILEYLVDLFKDRLYVEIGRNEAAPSLGRREQPEDPAPRSLEIEGQLIDWAYEKGLPLIATNETLFLEPEDYEAHDALRCIALGRYVQEQDRPRCSPYHYFRSPLEMADLFHDLQEALINTQHLMKRCHFLLKPSPPVLPTFPCNLSEEEELTLQSQKGLEHRLVQEVLPLHPETLHEALRHQYQARLAYESTMIVSMGFSGYFLIVADFIKWAKENRIPVGPGRGSGASSLVAWSLSITDVDPIRFGLFFERFLNPDRVSMPDFDVDFCQSRRDEVIAYVAEKYGKERVAHIITFGTLQARVVLRDVGRVLQMSYGQVDKICKLIPHNPANPLSLQEALMVEPQLRAQSEEDEQVKQLIHIGMKLEGLYRHASTHAAGVIISRDPLQDTLPLYQDEGSLLAATEFSMKYVESAGLVKFDFLGLKTLTVLQSALDLLEDRGVHLNLTQIPLDDGPTFELLRRVETVGVFQLESRGMSDVLAQLQPERFEELVALVALYRPGPMDDIPRYIACKHGREPITYAYPCLQEILKETFGVMVYQEQVMQIAQVLAGYSLGSADLLRRAMGKKMKSEMDDQRKVFVEGTLSHHGGSHESASTLFDQIAKFAGYAFPKAHATPYGLIAYQTAYMKANYPVEFMTALMICDMHNTDKLRGMVRETKRLGISVLPPDINASAPLFSVEQENVQGGAQSIRYGLAAIKNVGQAAMEKVHQDRLDHGKFTDIFDFIQRVSSFHVNKKHLESLITAGAMDSIYPERSHLMASVESLIRYGTSSLSTDQLLFSMETVRPSLKIVEPWSCYESLRHELNSVGFYLTAHPLDSYVSGAIILHEDMGRLLSQKGQVIPMMGMVMEVIEKISRGGQKYAFIHLSDPTGSYEVSVFSDLLAQSRSLLTVGTALFLRVHVRLEGDSVRLSAQEIRLLEDVEQAIELTLTSESQLLTLHHHLSRGHGGSTRIHCKLVLDGAIVVHMKTGGGFRLTPELRASLMELTAPLTAPATE